MQRLQQLMPRAAALRALLGRLRRDRRGNVLMLFGFAIVPLVFAAGMSIDYGRAMRTQTKMNAAADAAALAAVSKTIMSGNAAQAKLAAWTMFYNQTAGMVGNGGLVIDYTDAAQLKITVVDTTPSGTTSVQRTATVSYVAKSQNSFAGILGLTTLNIRGTSATTATTAPNIDFYMTLDISSSMAIPTTTAGLNLLSTKTKNGCMFACHNTNDERATAKDGTSTDYYGVAKSYGIPLRIDAMVSATSGLASIAKSTSSSNRATYRMAIGTFSEAGSFAKFQALTSDLSSAGTKAATVEIPTYYANGYPTRWRSNNDQDTATSEVFDKMNSWMVDPGQGSNKRGDTPQEIMFLITDGMRDEYRPSGKPEVAIDTAKCDTIKNRGIRIAILYTEYLPAAIANDDWSVNPNGGDVYNRINQVAPALQSCASSGLYYKVTTNDDIASALNSLFQKAVATAHLTQ